MSEVKDVSQGKLKVRSLKPESEISRRELLKRLSPLGKVKLDAQRCTGCGLCALECPTGALAVSSGRDAFQLLFKHGDCVVCDRCVEICPEQCLSVERILEPGKMDSQTVLFEDEIARCPECGSPIGPKAMVAKLRARMATTGHDFPARLELCPDCKAKVRLGRLRI